MKRFFAVLAVFGISTSFLFAEGIKIDVQNSYCQKLKKISENAEKRALYFEKIVTEANANNQKELAEAGQKCGDIKKGISVSLNNYFKAIEVINNESNIDDKTAGDIDKILEYKKGGHLSTKIKSLETCSAELEKNIAENTEDKIVQDNKKIAEQLNVMAENLKKYQNGEKDYENAYKEYKKTKNEVEKNK